MSCTGELLFSLTFLSFPVQSRSMFTKCWYLGYGLLLFFPLDYFICFLDCFSTFLSHPSSEDLRAMHMILPPPLLSSQQSCWISNGAPKVMIRVMPSRYAEKDACVFSCLLASGIGFTVLHRQWRSFWDFPAPDSWLDEKIPVHLLGMKSLPVNGQQEME